MLPSPTGAPTSSTSRQPSAARTRISIGLPATLSCTVDIARSDELEVVGVHEVEAGGADDVGERDPEDPLRGRVRPGDGRVGSHDDDGVREEPGEIGDVRRVHGPPGSDRDVPAYRRRRRHALRRLRASLTGATRPSVRFPAPWMPSSPAAPASSDRTSSTRLLARGDRVRVLDDLSTGRRENVAAGAELVVGSIVDEDVVARAVAGIEVVFHLGALGAVSRSVADPRASNAANVDGTLNVLTPARDAGVRRVVFASSSSVYGGAEVVPTPESTPLRPRSPYANTKLAGEWYIRLLRRALRRSRRSRCGTSTCSVRGSGPTPPTPR